MYQFKGGEDTIAAISTAIGQGALGVVRLSGTKAVAIADEIFVGKTPKKPSAFKNFTVHYGWIVRPEQSSAGQKRETVDEVLMTLMRAPHSYTREDMVEVSCHGGVVSLKGILELMLEGGARLAEPGEFTRRAFLNGRIDLTQAEAVLDIIQARTDAFLRVSANQLKGALSLELEGIREALMNVYIELEAIVNFPEDDIDAGGREGVLKKISVSGERVSRLLQTGEQGRILKEGIRVVLCGKPNVGKSSLLNELLRQPRAIVSAIAGTTRDTIEETANINGIPLQLIDTAGILKPRDLIEEEAVKRSRMSIESADLVLLILDQSSPLTSEDHALIDQLGSRNFLIVLNKCDLLKRLDEQALPRMRPEQQSLKVSALTKNGIEELKMALIANVWQGKTGENQALLISNVRHVEALRHCYEALEKAGSLLKEGSPFELVSEEIKSAVNFLDNITGRNIDSDLLENIFSQFCIGK